MVASGVRRGRRRERLQRGACEQKSQRNDDAGFSTLTLAAWMSFWAFIPWPRSFITPLLQVFIYLFLFTCSLIPGHRPGF
jgi:hypothetical protein